MKIARLVCARRLPNEQELIEAFNKLPTSDVVVTPGGLLKFQLPKSFKTVRGWQSTERSLHAMCEYAEQHMHQLVSPGLLAAMQRAARYVTLGVDLFYDKPLDTAAELIAVLDTDAQQIVHWTGKSFPRCDEEHDILHVHPIDSHTLRIGNERILILGCHDLNAWSGRSRANQDPNGRRRQRCDALCALANEFRPTIVLQHPHATDTHKTWTVAWAGIKKAFPNLKAWAAGIGWFHEKGGEIRGKLDDVCAHTKSPNVMEVVV